MELELVTITPAIRKEYLTALYNSQSGYACLMEEFKSKYPKEFKLINTMYRKRVAINDSIKVMEYLEEPIYWFTLTFNNSKDANTIPTKRKECQRFLNTMSSVYLMVEEFGEDNGRYHVHGFMCFKFGYGFLDFRQWHSRCKLLECKDSVRVQKVRYLTNYAVKSVPRIRRSKSLSRLYASFKKKKSYSRNFPQSFKLDFNKEIEKVVNPF